MDQTGSQPKSISEMLKELADFRRAHDHVEGGRGQLIQPTSPAGTQMFEEPKPIEQIKTEISVPSITEDEPLLTSADAAKFLGYSEKSFRNSVALGKIPHYRLFNQNRFKKSELLGLLVRVEPNKS